MPLNADHHYGPEAKNYKSRARAPKWRAEDRLYREYVDARPVCATAFKGIGIKGYPGRPGIGVGHK